MCNFSPVILAGHCRGGVREGRAQSHLPQAASRVCGGWAVFWGLPSASSQPCPVARLSRRCTWAAGTHLLSSLRGWLSQHAPHQDRKPVTAPCPDLWDLTASCHPPPRLGQLIAAPAGSLEPRLWGQLRMLSREHGEAGRTPDLELHSPGAEIPPCILENKQKTVQPEIFEWRNQACPA